MIEKIKNIISNNDQNWEYLAKTIEDSLKDNSILYLKINNKIILENCLSNFYFLFFADNQWQVLLDSKNYTTAFYLKSLLNMENDRLVTIEPTEEIKILKFIKSLME